MHHPLRDRSAIAAWKIPDLVTLGRSIAPNESPAGGITGSGTKLIDGMISIVGLIYAVTAQKIALRTGPDPLDVVTVMLKFECGISGMICTVRSTPAYSRFHVFGDLASAEVLNETRVILRKTGGKVEYLDSSPQDSVLVEMDAFADAITSGTPYPISATEALETIATLEAIVTSIGIGATVVLRHSMSDATEF